MGNFCSSKQESYHLYTQQHLHPSHASSADEYKSPLSPLSLLSPSSASYPAGPCVIPSLFDLCVQQLCLSLLDSHSVSEIRGRRKQSIRMTDQQLFILRQLRDRMAGEAATATTQDEYEWRDRDRERDRERRFRSLSVSAKESPELSPQPTVGFSPRWLPVLSPDPRIPSPENVNLSVSHAVQGKYTASSRSLSAQYTLQRKDSLSSLPSSPSAISYVDSGILRSMQSPHHQHQPYPTAVSMPASPTFAYRNRSYDEADAEVPMLSHQPTQRSVSSYAGSAMSWAWEKGRRRSWFAGSLPPPHSPSTSAQLYFAYPPRLEGKSRGRLRLPESIVELIFHRLISQRLLTLSCLELFAGGGLVRIDLGGYEGVTDQWLDVLLSGGSRHGGGGVGYGGGVRGGGRDERKARDESSGEDDEEELSRECEMEEGDEQQADEDDEERKEQADKSYMPMVSSRAIDIEQPDKPSPSVPSAADPWSTTSSPLLGRSRALPSSLASTQSSSLSSSHQTPAPLSSSPAIKSLAFSSLPSPAAFSLSSPLRHALYTLSVRSLDLSGCDAISDRPLYNLHNCPYLTHLNLDGCTQVSDELLTSVLPSLHSLLSLNVNNCRSVSDATLAALASHVRLQHLQLDNTAISDSGLALLSQLTRLRTLSVGWNGNRVTNTGLAWLASCFSLRRLCICYTAVTDVSPYRSLQRLRQLDVSGTKVVVPSSAVAVRLDELQMQRCKLKELPAVFLHHGLKRLDGGFCAQISSSKWAAQLAMLARSRGEDEKERERRDKVVREEVEREQDGPQREEEEEEDEVEVDGVSGCYEVDQAVSYSPSTPSLPATTPQSMPLLPLSGSSFSSAFSSLPSLSLSSAPPLLDTLILESCNVDNQVASLLPSFPLLTHLNLSDTEVDQDGLQHLSPLTHLRSLNLSGNRLNNASLVYLSPLTSLTALHLDSVAIGDAGLLHLQPLTALTLLDLFECSITDVGVGHLTCLTALQTLEICSTKLTNGCLPHLLHLPTLTSLNLARNAAIDDRGVGILAGLTRLVHLNLSHSGVTHKGVGEGLAGLGSVKCVSLFGCRVNVSHERMRLLPVGVQVGVDQGIVAVGE